MSYGKSTLLKTAQLLSERRLKAENIQRAHHSEVIAKLPEIAKYEIGRAHV